MIQLYLGIRDLVGRKKKEVEKERSEADRDGPSFRILSYTFSSFSCGEYQLAARHDATAASNASFPVPLGNRGYFPLR